MPKVLPSRAALASGSSKESTPSTHVARNNRTWRRTENISSLPYAKPGLSNGQSSEKFANTQSATSYVRKGRSLVRNPGAVPAFSNGANGLNSTSVYRLNPVNRTETVKSFGSETKNNTFKLQNGFKTGDRVFRIGSVRYKMDSSRRTLQRIPDENPPSGLKQQSGRNSRMSFIPKRLLIGNKEYIRIGNGNQLVRDPKTRIRTLASEKVRWSLHSARLRLAKKQQYCQFFTRFGKCNKEGGKCRFIHDPAKIAVCTKFLKGLCTDTNCKLTHKVIPERMQDCSYFLQGLCTNENCPYRHVNVNPDSSVCEGFLRGYCVDGDECNKKHSYVCPQFESTGECPQGKKCKLHHPSRNVKSRKRKRPEEHNLKHIRGRYFGSNRFDAEIESGRIASSGHRSEQKKNEDSFFPEGGMDYISLDVSGSESDNVEEDEAQGTTNDAMDTSTDLFKEADSSSDHLMLQLDDLDDDDDLFKPIAIMNVTTKRTHT
ncbi:hypothetical protein MKW94_024368 [Papaver nudicaule]|uniref:C3H1-type domain-containing protein n=1 Tax=Papaver nudicaule TaxID=74823 RepID=A0AA41RW69_PAPNU|nr:hypothetical protein [Papaver nudicaule]